MTKQIVFPVGDNCHTLFPDLEVVQLSYSKDGFPHFSENDLIIFAGGTDVNPEYYGEKRGSRTSRPDYRRDHYESMVFKSFPKNPKLGICRGAQLLNVLNGGKLIQDVSHHCQNHLIHLTDGRKVTVTSTHHQMMLPALKGELLAWALGQSDYYLDGDDIDSWGMGLHLDSLGVTKEPEIVWYPQTKSLCIQGHPEYGHATEEFRNLTNELCQKYLGVK